MKIVVPLDSVSLRGIPTALEGKFYIGGPYELSKLLQEPEQYGDESIDRRDVEVINAPGVKTRSASIEIASGFARIPTSLWPGQATLITQKLRYLYRDKADATIEGAVEIALSYSLGGLRQRFSVETETIIGSVYVNESSRGRGIARILLAEILLDLPNVKVHPQFSESGARLFGFDKHGNRVLGTREGPV